MAVPTSNIKMTDIAEELGISETSVVLDNCRANSISYVLPASPSIPGHSRDGNEQTNSNAGTWNNTMAEWAGYTHTQAFSNSVTYYLRTDSYPFDTDNGVANRTSQLVVDGEDDGVTYADIGLVFYYILNGSTIEWYMHPADFATFDPISSSSKDASAYAYNTSGGSVSLTGDYSVNGGSGVSAQKIAQFTPDSTSGLQVRMRSNSFLGTNSTIGGPPPTPAHSLSAYTITSDWQTPSSTKYGLSHMASSGVAFCYGSSTNQAAVYLHTEVKATGYETLNLRTIVSYIFANANSTGCV